jgi:DNA-binding CsgD family transcriptional regulator
MIASLALAPSSPRSPLLAAYNHWANADFGELIRELDRVTLDIQADDRVEASLLRARALLRLDRAKDALEVLGYQESTTANCDQQVMIRSLRGIALVSLRRNEGIALLRSVVALAKTANVNPDVRMEATYSLALGLWLAGHNREADNLAQVVSTFGSDITAVRSVALRAWVRVAEARYDDAVALFRKGWKSYRRCVARDAGFEAGLVNAIATYELQGLQEGRKPRYYSSSLPRVGTTALDTHMLIVGMTDAERAALAGDEPRAIDAVIATDAARVDASWRIAGLASRARIARCFGHRTFAVSFARTAFAIASTCDWNDAGAESRLALLDVAEEAVHFDIRMAEECLSTFKRISRPLHALYGGNSAIHEARIAHARGLVDVATGATGGRRTLLEAADRYEALGFSWRVAEVQLGLHLDESAEGRQAFEKGRKYILERFPNSHLARGLPGYIPKRHRVISAALTDAQREIVRALCDGRTTRQIAQQRGTSIGTVYNQLKDIYQRTGVRSIREVILRFGCVSS